MLSRKLLVGLLITIGATISPMRPPEKPNSSPFKTNFMDTARPDDSYEEYRTNFDPYDIFENIEEGLDYETVNQAFLCDPRIRPSLIITAEELLERAKVSSAPLAARPNIPPKAFLEREYAGKIPTRIIEIAEELVKPIDQRKVDFKNVLLLYGPSGTGKTMLARLLARATGRELREYPATQIGDSYKNSTPLAVKNIFLEAKKLGAPVLIFIDEVDCIALRRNGAESRDNESATHVFTSQEERRGVMELCRCLTDYADDPNIFTVFATNMFEDLDKAFQRRLAGCTVEVKLPDSSDRAAIVRHYAQQKSCKLDGVDFEQIAKSTEGFCGDELKQLVNEAIRLAAKETPANSVLILTQKLFNQACTILKESLKAREPKRPTNWHAIIHTANDTIRTAVAVYGAYQGDVQLSFQKHVYEQSKSKEKSSSDVAVDGAVNSAVQTSASWGITYFLNTWVKPKLDNWLKK